MDTRRYQQTRSQRSDVTLSSRNLPALVVISLGVLCLVVGVVLIAAFGLPKDVSEKPQQVSGPIAGGVGLVFIAIGAVLAIGVKKRHNNPQERRVSPKPPPVQRRDINKKAPPKTQRNTTITAGNHHGYNGYQGNQSYGNGIYTTPQYNTRDTNQYDSNAGYYTARVDT